jgi:hypothetical protein
MGLGSSLFARHYSGNRGFFPFLWVLRCFSSPACHCLPYVFRQEHARITTRRFPHSEIPGSAIGQHLPRAYRSRPRPSSALGAKASTVCSCSLDQKEHVCCHYGVFKVHAGRRPALPRRTVPCLQRGGGTVSQNSTAYGLRRRGRRCFQANRVIGRSPSRGTTSTSRALAMRVPAQELGACRSKSLLHP